MFGVSGISDDMRTLLASDDPSAKRMPSPCLSTVSVANWDRIAAALGGLDALVFTAGIGEHAAEIRRRVCEEAAWLGVDLDRSGKRRRRPNDHRQRQPDLGLGHSDRRRSDDCAPCLDAVKNRRGTRPLDPHTRSNGSSNSKCTDEPAKDLSLLSVPAFWPMAMATTMLEEGTELYAKNLKFVEEEIKIHDDLRPTLATPNQVRLDLRTMVLRDYGKPGGIPTLVDAPHAGHTAMIADYHEGQSLVRLCWPTASAMWH